MNNQEAKFVLGAYRPSGQDAGDPAMAQALAQAKNDPALGAWFAREQAHDTAVAAKLRDVVPPAGLRAAILAGARMSGGANRATKEATAVAQLAEEKSVEAMTRRAWWRQPVWLAAAAAIAVLLSVLTWQRLTPAGGATLEEFAVNFVDKGFLLQKHSADVAVLKAWLSEQRGPLPDALPAKFAELSALGCKKLDFQGRDVSLVCFERGGKEYHVFVTRLDEAGGGAGEGRTPRFIEDAKSGLVAATWFDAKNRYVVVSDAGMAALKGVL